MNIKVTKSVEDILSMTDEEAVDLQKPGTTTYEIRVNSDVAIKLNLRTFERSEDYSEYSKTCIALQNRQERGAPGWSDLTVPDLMAVALLHIYGVEEQYRKLSNCKKFVKRVGTPILGINKHFFENTGLAITDDKLEEVDLETDGSLFSGDE